MATAGPRHCIVFVRFYRKGSGGNSDSVAPLVNIMISSISLLLVFLLTFAFLVSVQPHFLLDGLVYPSSEHRGTEKYNVCRRVYVYV